MSEHVTNAQIFAAVSKLEGRMDGVIQLITSMGEGLNRRIDDNNRAVIARIELQDSRLKAVDEKAEEARLIATRALSAAKRSGTVSGGSAATAVAVGFELVKALLK